MEKTHLICCCPEDTQFKETQKGGLFDIIDSPLDIHASRQIQNRGHYCADMYFLDKKKNHKEILEFVQKNQLEREFTFEEAFFLLNKAAHLFPSDAEWKFIVYLYSTVRYLSVFSKKISNGGNPKIEKRIMFCREAKPFYDYPAGTGVLLRH